MQLREHSVDEAQAMLKRLYTFKREMVFSLAGWFPGIELWELKKLVPRHMWLDALHVDAFRTRLLEMRYPLRDVDDGVPEEIVQFVDRIRRGQNDAEFVAAFYLELRRALVAAYEGYLDHTDAHDDSPSVRIVRIALAEEREMLEGIAQIWERLQPQRAADEMDRWRTYIRTSLERIGGVLAGPAQPLKPLQIFEERPAFKRVDQARRDPRFAATLYHEGGTQPAKTPAQVAINQAVSHLNELWAAEVPASCVWDRQDLPWDFYVDAARWLYDEMRHCIMGEQRLLAWGLSYEELPLGTIQYDMMSQEPVLYRLGLLHHRECNGIGSKRISRDRAREQHIVEAAQDFDYDWADERIHVKYGSRWLRYLAGAEHADTDDDDLLRRLRDEGNARMVAHYKEMEASDHPLAHRRPQDELLAKADALLGAKIKAG